MLTAIARKYNIHRKTLLNRWHKWQIEGPEVLEERHTWKNYIKELKETVVKGDRREEGSMSELEGIHVNGL